MRQTIRTHLQTSHPKLHGKFSLKELLPQNLDFQRNYFSQQAQQTQRAPTGTRKSQTLTTAQPIPNLQHPNRTQSQLCRHRQQSGYKIVQSSEGPSVHSVSHQDKLRMKLALGRMNLLAEGNFLAISEQEQLEAVFQFVECLAEIHNHHQSAFQYLYRKLKPLVFASPTADIAADVRLLAENTGNQHLLYYSHRNTGKTTYRQLARELTSEARRAVADRRESEEREARETAKWRDTLQEKQQTMGKLKRQLKYYQEHPSQDLYPYLTQLQQQNAQLQGEIENLVTIKGEYEYQMQTYQKTIELLSEELEKLRTKISSGPPSQTIPHPSKIQQEIHQFESNVEMLHSMLDKSKMKLLGLKQQFECLSQQYDSVVDERSILARRAAVGFAELTPRPNLRQILKDRKLNYDTLLPTKSKKYLSTDNAVKVLVDKIQMLTNNPTHAGNCEAVRETANDKCEEQRFQCAMDDLEAAKNQINKTCESAAIVKRRLSRLKPEKDYRENNKNTK